MSKKRLIVFISIAALLFISISVIHELLKGVGIVKAFELNFQTTVVKHGTLKGQDQFPGKFDPDERVIRQLQQRRR